MLTFLVLNAGAVAAALLTAMAAGATGPTSRLLLATLSGYLIAIYAVTLVAGLAGSLVPAGLLVVMAAAVALAGWLARRRRRVEALDAGARFGAAGLAAALTASAAGVAWAWPHLVDATRLWIWDDYTYHMVYPALWLRRARDRRAARRRTPSPCRRGIRSAASVVAAWFMAAVPRRARRGARLGQPHRPALRRHRRRRRRRAAARGSAAGRARGRCRSSLFATSRAHRRSWPRASRTPISPRRPRCSARFVFAIPREPDEAARDVGADAWYAALLTRHRPRREGQRRARSRSIILRHGRASRAGAGGGVARAGRDARSSSPLAWAATAGYWYARNVVHTGNPVYPAALLFWPGATFPETTLLEYAHRYGAAADASPTRSPSTWTGRAFTRRSRSSASSAWRAGSCGGVARSPAPAQRYFAGGALAIVAAILRPAARPRRTPPATR